MTAHQKALLALFLTMCIWGFGAVATRFLVKDLDPADVLIIRYAISCACFAAAIGMLRGPRVTGPDWLRFGLCGLLGVTGYNIAASYGMQTTPASLAGLILGAEPVMIAVFAALLLGERIRPFAAAGLAVASIGTVILVAGDHGLGEAAGTGTGPWLILIGAAAWSLFAVLIRPLIRTYGPIRATALASLAGSAPLLLLARPSLLATAGAMTGLQWAVTLYLAIPATVFSLVLWNYGNRTVSPAAAAAFIYAVPVVSVIAGIVVLGEQLTSSTIAGGLLVMAGVALAQFAPRRKTASAIAAPQPAATDR
jgi:drug/metabolite transporter (DMT)-like permease